MTSEAHTPGFLQHEEGDCVAVAVRELEPGTVEGGSVTGSGAVSIQLRERVPLGHKLALRDVPVGGDVIEYGVRVGVASADIARGDYVHVHNMRSARWQNSVA